MLFKLPLLLIVESYFFFFNTNAHRTPIYKTIQQDCSGWTRYQQRCKGQGPTCSVPSSEPLKNTRVPGTDLCKAPLHQKDSTILRLPFLRKFILFHIKKLNLYVNVVIGKIPLSLTSHTQYISKCRSTSDVFSTCWVTTCHPGLLCRMSL